MGILPRIPEAWSKNFLSKWDFGLSSPNLDPGWPSDEVVTPELFHSPGELTADSIRRTAHTLRPRGLTQGEYDATNYCMRGATRHGARDAGWVCR